MAGSVSDRAIRVGVTGARKLDPGRLPLIERGVLTALDAIRRQLTADEAPGSPLLRLLSPLAEGADRVVAELAIRCGYRLEAILPFAEEEYKRDFATPVTPGLTPAQCLAEFDQLRSQASSVLELDGGRDAESASYEAVGRAVVRNSDVLLAIWNGMPGAGRGGTADTVRFALELGVPVWWVRADDGEARWIEDASHLSATGVESPTAEALVALERHLAVLFESEVGTPERRPWWKLWTASRRAVTVGGTGSREPPKRRRWFSAYGMFERQLTRGVVNDPYPTSEVPDDVCWSYWQHLYKKENDASSIYMSAYRSAYLIIFLLAAAILSMEGLSIAWPDHQAAFKFLEVFAMAIVGLIVLAGKREGWHARAISHRLTAELIRKQSYLSLLGSSLRATAELGGASSFIRYLRSAPLASGRFEKIRTSKILDFIKNSLLQDQEVYHRNRNRKMLIASQRLAKIANALFFGGLIVAIAQLLSMTMLDSAATDISFALIGAALPAFAAFAMGIRSYAELEIVAEQSARMEVFMYSAERKLLGIDCAETNASQALGELLQSIATKMLEDLQGWSTVSRSKALEAG